MKRSVQLASNIAQPTMMCHTNGGNPHDNHKCQTKDCTFWHFGINSNFTLKMIPYCQYGDYCKPLDGLKCHLKHPSEKNITSYLSPRQPHQQLQEQTQPQKQQLSHISIQSFMDDYNKLIEENKTLKIKNTEHSDKYDLVKRKLDESTKQTKKLKECADLSGELLTENAKLKQQLQEIQDRNTKLSGGITNFFESITILCEKTRENI